MKYNTTKLTNRLEWEIGDTEGKRGSRKVKTLILSDGVTEIPYSQQLHEDLEAFETRCKSEASAEQSPVQPLRNVG